MPIILRRVLFRMVTRSQNRHLVPVGRVIVKEVARLPVDLARAELVAPQMQQLLVHRPRAHLADFAQAPEHREFGVCHAHVGFVGLYVCRCYGLQLGGRRRVEEFLQDGLVEVILGPGDELFEVDFAD
jgi:hypothetical protein